MSDNDFERWWYEEGSGMPPLPSEDAEEHVKRVSRIAWKNGAYCEDRRWRRHAKIMGEQP